MLFGSCLFQSVTRVVTQSVPLFLSRSLSSSVSPSLPQSVSTFISASVSQSFSQSVTPSVPLSLSQSFSTYFVCLSVSHSLPPSLPTSHLHFSPPPHRSITIHTSQKSEPSAGTGTFPAAANNTPGLPSRLQAAQLAS